MKKVLSLVLSAVLSFSALVGCDAGSSKMKGASDKIVQENYEGRTFYEVFVRAFKDSNGDGIGDLKGVEESLDYLKELGVNGIWLMPITDSESYHGYDTTDYYTINPDYGTMDDLKSLIKEANKRDIKIIMDLVLNHTSVDHPWFIEASSDENSEYRDYYVWTDDMSKASEGTTMNTNRWTQNGSKEELYESVFWSGMPDLNYDNEKVVEEAKDVAKYYLDLGIDGFRLDAVKWISDDDEKNVEFWKDFSKYVKSINEDAILVGEVWDKPYSIYTYAGGLDSFFDFSLGDAVVKALYNKSFSSLVDTFNKNYDMYLAQNKDFVLATFLYNHDQNRIMSTLNGDTEMAKMAAAIYLTLPGTPYIYYGEEIGMTGTKPDEKIREPFIWSSTDLSQNTIWEASTNDISKVALDVQEKDDNSLYNFYKELLNVRLNRNSLRLGTVENISQEDKSILVMKRNYESEETFVIINSSNEEKEATLPSGKYNILFTSDKERESENTLEEKVTIKPHEVLIVY